VGATDLEQLTNGKVLTGVLVLTIVALALPFCTEEKKDKKETSKKAVTKTADMAQECRFRSSSICAYYLSPDDYPDKIDKIPDDSELPGLQGERFDHVKAPKKVEQTISNKELFSPITKEEIESTTAMLLNKSAAVEKYKKKPKHGSSLTAQRIKNRRLTLEDIGYKMMETGIETGHILAYGLYLDPPYQIEIDKKNEQVRINGVPICPSDNISFLQTIRHKDKRQLNERIKHRKWYIREKKKMQVHERHWGVISKAAHLPPREAYEMIRSDFVADPEVKEMSLISINECNKSITAEIMLKNGYKYETMYTYGMEIHKRSPAFYKNNEPSRFVKRCLHWIPKIVAGIERDLVVVLPGHNESIVMSKTDFRKILSVLKLRIDYDSKMRMMTLCSIGLTLDTTMFLIANTTPWVNTFQ
jgi:hypothetical protein